MDSHSRSASPREPSRPQHRPPSPPASPAGFDNRAYQHDDADPNHNDSFASQPHQNGHTKELNGDTKLEAVNLELINLTPKNGNAKKKDVEVDMNAANPYDEYFVPVNEHRKYMRGEKLYVTADKRGEKGGCKRPLCWTLLGLVVAAIVALIVLAATGILFTNSPTPLEPYNTSVSSARALGGIGHVHSHDHDHDHGHHDHDHHDHTTQLPTTHAPDAQNEDGHNPSDMSEESGDMSVYVPKTVEGELKIDNKDFVSALEDPDSEEYKEFTSTFSDALKRALFDRNIIDNGDNEIIVEVVRIKEGSIIVTYRIHWKPRSNAEPKQDLLTTNTLKSKLAQYLDSNNRMISVYHVAEDKMATRSVLDLCQISNNDCEYGCEFDDTTLDFTCTCPYGQIQDMRSPKNCISILDDSVRKQDTEKHEEKELKVLTLEDTDKMRAIPEEEKPDLQTVHMADDETAFDWKEPHLITPEPTTETDDDLNYSHIFGHPRSKNDDIEAETTQPESTPVAEPEPEPSPTAEPKPEPTAEPKPEPEPAAEPKPEPTVEPKPEPAAEPTSEPTAEPKPEPTVEPKAEPEPAVEPKPEPEPTAEPIPINTIRLKPTSESTSEPEIKTEIKPDFESNNTVKPESEPVTTPTTMPTVVPEYGDQPKPEPEPTPEPGVIANLNPEPTSSLSEPNPLTESNSSSELDPSSEPSPLSKQNSSSEPTSDSSIEPKPEPEPTAEPNPDAISKHISEVKPEREPTVVFRPEPELSKEFNRESETEMEPTSEPNISVIPAEEKFKDDVESKSKFGRNLENEQTNADSTEYQDKIKIDTEVNKNMQEDNIPPEIVSVQSLTTTQPNSGEELEQQTTERTNVETNDSNIESDDKSNGMNVPSETTTSRISISEPNIINEPSYEPKPEIISILSEQNEKSNETLFTSADDDDYLSNDSSWSQNDTQESPETNFKMSDDQISATEVTSIAGGEDSGTEHRLSKNLNSKSIFDTTTKDTTNSKNDLTFELRSKNEENSGDSTAKVNDKIPMTTSLITQNFSEVPTENTYVSTNMSNETMIKNYTPQEESRDELTSEFKIKEAEIPTVEVQKENEFSINQQFQDSIEEKNLINVLEKKNYSDSQLHTTNTESYMHNENDVTFDAINMLYNRTSKSIENNSVQQITESTSSTDSSETTDSDWLSEPVTEVNYKEAMNKMENYETTETSVSKIDEVINRGVSKDDFEPDYLNNMGSNTSKMTEPDEPLYGMTHDYENDDLRVKRVNTERKETDVTDTNKNISESNGTFESSSITPIDETSSVTTVTQYIYKLSEKYENTSISDNENLSDVNKENDQDEMSPASTKQSEISKPIVSNDDAIAIPTTTLATTMISVGENKDPDIATESPDDNAQNSTQVNNLNVTIYEISSHNGNQTNSTPNHKHPQSAEYDDHETEMNPFLPEAENNKILVKKLQEGHDLELVNLNETQNENIEDHVMNISENATNNNASQLNNDIAKSNVTSANIKSSEVSMITTEENALYNELHTGGGNPQSTEDDSHVTTDEIKMTPTVQETTEISKVKSEEVLPISTFLLDTDDLDVPKHFDEEKQTLLDNNVKNEVTNSSNEATTTSTPKKETENEDSEYLSVVPIEPETLEDKQALKNYNSENIQELNYISDSPKKSDRRTIDTTNLESIINNEA